MICYYNSLLLTQVIVEQVRIMLKVSFETIVDNILGCGLRPDGSHC